MGQLSITLVTTTQTVNVSVDGKKALGSSGSVRVPCLPGNHTITWNLANGIAGNPYSIDMTGDATWHTKGTLDAKGNAQGSYDFPTTNP